MLKKWWTRISGKPSQSTQSKAAIYSGVAGGGPPATSFALADLNEHIIASSTGPENGVRDMLPCMPGLQVAFDQPQPWACGHSTSLYDAASSSGVRAGDPIADCFAVIAYDNHTLLAVADGVNWGEPARRAARSAVLGAVAHLHKELPSSSSGGPCLESSQVFKHMLEALGPAQKLILAQFGTLTTLVLTVVARLAAPLKWSSLRQPSSPSSRSCSHCYQWAAMTVSVGDSPAFVYRHLDNTVEELTYAGHAGAYRDPRWTPGALGYALGEEPDLSNLSCSVTLLNQGDIVFLTSDGVADNFDPFILKLARQACNAVQWTSGMEDSQDDETLQAAMLPAMDSEQSHTKQVELLTQAVQRQRAACAPGQGLSAQALVDGLLEHVMQVTEKQRQWAEQKQAAREAERQARRLAQPDFSERSLNTDVRCTSAVSSSLEVPPGKMDHATVAACLVGGH